jgi:hypothetical protein
MEKNSGDGVCRSLGVHEIGGIKVLIIRKNMFLQFRNAFKESFMDCSPIMSHEQSGMSRHGWVSSTPFGVPFQQMSSSEGFQQHFSIISKVVCCGFYIKENVAFTLISFAVLK